MKKIITLFALVIPFFASAQSIYYDAVEISRIIKDSTTYSIPTDVQCAVTPKPEVCKNFDRLITLLRRHIDRVNVNEMTNSEVIRHYRNNNPYFKFLPEHTATGGGAPANFGATSKVLDFVGGLNVTDIADGVAQFLIERANEELNVLFFDRFKTAMEKSIELKTLFPETYNVLMHIEPYQYASMIQILKEAFQSDIKNLIINLENFADLPKYKKLILENDLQFVYAGLEAAKIVSAMAKGVHPALAISDMGKTKNLAELHGNLPPSLQTLSLFSNAVRDTTTGRGWVDGDSIRINVLNKSLAYVCFLGLIYEHAASITFTRPNGAVITLQEVLKNKRVAAVALRDYYGKIALGVDHIETLVREIRQVRAKGEKPGYELYYNTFDASIVLIENSFGVVELLFKSDLNPKVIRQFHRFAAISHRSNDIYKNINEKNYSLAVMNFVVVYDSIFSDQLNFRAEFKKEPEATVRYLKNNTAKPDYLMAGFKTEVEANSSLKAIVAAAPASGEVSPKDQDKIADAMDAFFKKSGIDPKFREVFLKYGAFIASVAQAESAADVKNALHAAALPAGSATIKKNVPFNIALNGYLGAYTGHENLFGSAVPDDKTNAFNTGGVYAPVGITFSTSIRRKTSGKSFSLFAQFVDLGSIAAFRLQNGNAADLPETQLKNIFSPGLYGVFGFGKIPLSLGVGFQKGPNLREIKLNQGQATPVEAEANRTFSIFLAFDIPIFNLYTMPKD